MRRIFLSLVLVTVVFMPGDARAETAVAIKTSQFEPRDVIVVAGDPVVWTNGDPVTHTVTADDGSFDSHPECTSGGACMEPGEVFSYTFEKAGQIPYYCRLHGGAGGVGMAGTVIVLGAP